MKRKILCLFALLVCSPVASAAPKVAETTKACLLPALTAYETELLSRVGDQNKLARQPFITAQGLVPLDGRMILQVESYTLAWDANLGNVAVWVENQSLALSHYVDNYGRLAFAGETVSGLIDLSGSEVNLILRTPSSGLTFWTGQLVTTVDEAGTSNTTLYMANPRKCLCRRSNSTSGCSDVNDCLNRAPCTRPNGGASSCIMAIAPLDIEGTAISGNP